MSFLHSRPFPHLLAGALLSSLLFAASAWAVPQQLSQQGRLFDAEGAALSGTYTLSFALYDAPSGGALVWEESLSVELVNGFYVAVLGSDELGNPLDELVLEQFPLYVELSVDGGAPLSPRQELRTAPYAVMAQTAESVRGGAVDAGEVLINGATVIDGSGTWVGPTPAVAWADVTGVPAELADGDADTLAALGCVGDQLAVYSTSASAWTCGTDTDSTLSEAEVQAAIEAAAALRLPATTTLDGDAILGSAHASDPDAHHPADGSGIDMTPASLAIGDTSLQDGSLDLGPGPDDELTPSMLATLTGGGAADALHSHAATGGGGGGSELTMLSDESVVPMNLGEAARYCNSLTEDGHADWSLPTLQDLWRVASRGGTVYADPTSANGLKTLSVSPNSYTLWIITYLADGGIGTSYGYSDHHVRCVR